MNMRKLAVGAALAAVATVAMATVIFNTDGTGWVGKGDVQTAFAWNNSAMQKKHTSISFEFEDTAGWTAICTWTTGPDNPNANENGQQTHTIKRTRTGLMDAVLSTDRKTGQYTGWTLRGFASGVETWEGGESEPALHGPCSANGINGEWTSVESAGGSQTLYAKHPIDGRRPIWTPPPPPPVI
jgi:hypothetical protein